MKHISSTDNSKYQPETDSARFNQKNIRPVFLAAIFLMVTFAMVSAQAQQTVRLNTPTTEFYVGVNDLNNHTNGFNVTSTNGTDVVNLNVSGVPANVTVTFSTNIVGNVVIGPTVTTINYVTNVLLSFVVGSATVGDYPLNIEVYSPTAAFTGRTNVLNLHIRDLLLWRGTNTIDTSWAYGTNWGPETAPVNGSSVKFENDGGATNRLSSSLTLSAFSYVPFVNNQLRETILDSGVTLLVTNGFIVNNDSESAGQSRKLTLNIVGTNASFVVSNYNADFSLNAFNSGAGGNVFDFSRLDVLRVEANRFGYGDVSLASQGSVGIQGPGTSFLAKTNIIRATYASPFDGQHFTNSIQFFNNEQAFNNGSAFTLNLGISNAFLADSFVIGRCRVAGLHNYRFAPAYSNSAAPIAVAYFRNTNGGRMSLYGQAVDSGTNAVNSGSGGIVDYTGGTLDLLADTIWLGHSRSGTTTNANARLRAFLTYNAGIIDVNTARLGYQAYAGDSHPEGKITVNGSGTLIVNTLLELGYYTGENTGPQGSSTYGQLVVSGATAKAYVNTITCGIGSGTGSASTRNGITVSGGGLLVVSNTISTASAKLGDITINNGSLTLFVNGLSTIAYTTNLSATAPATINIASISGVGASYPVTVPLISYETGSASFGIGTVPAGYYPDIVVDTGNKVVNLVIKTNQGRSLIWRGNVDGNWDTTTTNWVTTGLVPTKYQDGDYVRFDDTLTGASSTNVTISSTLTVGQVGAPGIVVSNTTKQYKFQGSGTLAGTAAFRKQGSGSLTIDTGITSENVLQVTGGTLLGAGNISGTTLGFGTAFQFSGVVSGSFVSSNASATLLTGGSIVGPISVQAGAFTNLGTLSGLVTIGNGTYLTNAGQINATLPWSVTTNSTLVNNGTITQTAGPANSGVGLNVNSGGTLAGTGTIDATGGPINDARVIINGGGMFKIGNVDNQVATVNINTRLDLNPTSTNVFDVINPATTNNDVILVGTSGKINWGDNNSGATVRINNLGSPFTLATTVYPANFANGLNFPDGNARRPVVIPPPAAGLAWDVSNTVTNGYLTVQGLPTFTSGVVNGTNLVMNWPDSYRGWRLEMQTNSLSVGIDPNSTNWTSVGGPTVTNVNQNIVLTNPAVFYRMVYP